jgi:hypothetical protein
MSKFPSSVQNLRAKPRGSRTVSAKPCSPATVEKRANIGVRLPISDKKLARVNQVTSSVTSKNP